MSENPIVYIIGGQRIGRTKSDDNRSKKSKRAGNRFFSKAGLANIKSIKDEQPDSTDESDNANPDGSKIVWPELNYDALYFAKLCPAGTKYWQGRDHFKQAITLEYNDGEPAPCKVTYGPGAGNLAQHEFEFYGSLGPVDSPALTYSAPVCNEFQQVLGIVDLRIKTGSLVYRFPQDDGTTRVVLYRPLQMRADFRCAGCFVVFTEDDNGTVKQLRGVKGEILKKYCSYKDGRKVNIYFNPQDGNVLATPKSPLTITYADGSQIKLHQVKERTAIFQGFLFDATGKPIETVLWKAELNVLQFQNLQTKEIRAQLFFINQDDKLPVFMDGRYNPDRGYFEQDGEFGQVIVRSIAPQRVDVRLPNGMIRFRDDNNVGLVAYAMPNGDAAVFHPDGTGVRLDATNYAMFYANASAHMCATAADVRSFMETTRSYTDRRDWAQLLFGFQSNTAALQSFVGQLNRLATVTVLPEPRRQALISCLLHQVAFRAEIFQGRTGSCNVAVIERVLAAISADKLVELIYLALTTASTTLASGRKFKLDVANLFIRSASGRNIADQIVQNILLQTATVMVEVDIDGDGVADKVIFRDTPDGAGEELKCDPLDSGENDCSVGGAVPPAEVVDFPGLDDALICQLCSEVTGVEFEKLEITTIEQLEAACLANPEVIVVVDGGKSPITKDDEEPDNAEATPDHVITVNGVYRDNQSGKCLVSFRNQWGLGSDHSLPSTWVDATTFMNNCMIEWSHFEENAHPGKRARIIVRKGSLTT